MTEIDTRDASGAVDLRLEKAIVRDFLDRLAASLIHGDFDAYAGLIALPFVVTTRQTRFIRTDVAGLRHGFDTWQRTIAANAVTEIFHRINTVDRFGTDGIIATHATEAVSDRTCVLPAFTNWIFLRRTGDDWKLEQMLSGVSNTYTSHFIQIDPANSNPLM